MPSVEDDYSDYIGYTSTLAHGFSLLAGFAFTTLTLLITLLPDPSQILAQFTLFFVMFVCDFLVFMTAWGTLNPIFFCRRVPPLTKQLTIFNYLTLSSISLFGVIPALMFLVTKLTYLALASVFVWAVFMIASYFVGWKPITTYRATRARMLARPREREKAV